MSLASGARAARLAREREEEGLLDRTDWLPGQDAFHRDASKRKLFRACNQAQGKSYAGCAEDIWHCLGRHPYYEVPAPPVVGAIVCGTWKQSLAAQMNLWKLLPKYELTDRARRLYSPSRGWGQDPAIEFRNGSILYVRTSRQGGIALSSAKLNFAHLDELPPSVRIYEEVVKRVTRTHGWIWSTLTPINQPADWLREMVEAGKISEHHYRLEPANMIPVDCDLPIRLDDGTFCDDAWIAEHIADTAPWEVPVTCHGEWDCRAVAPIFEAFHTSGPTTNLTDKAPAGKVDLYLGLDHGLRVHAQVALLMALQWPEGKAGLPVVWVMDEAVGGGMTTEDDDAEAVLAMLERHGIQWRNLHRVYGDRPHYGSNRRGSIARKSNIRLAKALEAHARAKSHGIARGNLDPPILPAKRGSVALPGAVEFGCSELHRLMVRPQRFLVHKRCALTIDALQKYDLTPNSDESHFVDAIRYGLRDYLYRGGQTGQRQLRQLRFT